jgi:lysozyme family protein
VQDNFQRCLSLVLKSEGGFVNNAHDPGGATNKGITQAVYDGWRIRQKQFRQSVRNISDAEVQGIYRVQFWDPIHGDDLPAGVDYATFDAVVNSGPVQGAKWLQRAVKVSADGHIGVLTLAAVNDNSARDVITTVCDQRLTFMHRLKQWFVFGRGWSNRMKLVLSNSLSMVPT